MRVLITGHNGYLGSVMVEVLQSLGHEVVGLDTFFFWRLR
jgi:nucleoside-diphosphate-sugar epimerase